LSPSDSNPSAEVFLATTFPGLLRGGIGGAREATGELLVFIDDDVKRFSAELVWRIGECFDDPEIVFWGGPSRPVFECDPHSGWPRYWQPDNPAAGDKMAQLSLLETRRGDGRDESIPNVGLGN